MKISNYIILGSIFFVFFALFAGKAVAVNENTNCDKEAEYRYPCGGHMEYRGLKSKWVKKYCTGTNYAKRSACLTEKEAIEQRKKLQKINTFANQLSISSG